MVLNFITNHISHFSFLAWGRKTPVSLSPERRQRLHSSSMLADFIDSVIIEEGVRYQLQLVCDTGTYTTCTTWGRPWWDSKKEAVMAAWKKAFCWHILQLSLKVKVQMEEQGDYILLNRVPSLHIEYWLQENNFMYPESTIYAKKSQIYIMQAV